MPRTPAIDVVIFPFTPVTKVETFEHAPVLKDSMVHLGIWENEFDAASLVADMDAAGVDKVLICAQEGGSWRVSHDATRALASEYPDRLLWTAGIDPRDIMGGVRALERAVTELGAVGAHSYPHWFRLPPDDRAYYPFYEKCVELGVPVSIHASANWTTSRSSDLGNPRHFDQLDCDFPELKLILSHAGYPWVLEACLLAWKHPNVYLELGAHRPKYFTTPGAGWDALFTYGQSTIQDKVLFGTGAFLISLPPALLVGEFRALPVKPEILEKWMWRNAAALLSLEKVA